MRVRGTQETALQTVVVVEGRTNDLQNTTQENYYIEETHAQAENPFIFDIMLPDYPSYLTA
jgi:hypothetical protein